MTPGSFFSTLSLRTRLLLIISLALAILLPLSYILAYQLIFPRFVDLETQRLDSDRSALETALMLRVKSVRSVARDWAQWDDSYEFVAGNNSEYVADNLDIESIVNLDVNLLVFFDLSGRVVRSVNVDLDRLTRRPIPAGLTQLLLQPERILDQAPPRPRSGLLAVDGLLVALAIEPITDSNREQASNGWLMAVRYLDGSLEQDTEHLVGTSFDLRWATHPAFNDADRAVLASLAAGEQTLSLDGEQQGTLEYRVDDILGQPILVRIQSALSIMEEGRVALARYQWILLLVLSVVMLMLTWAINWGVLSRLRRLQESVHNVGIDAAAEVVELSGRDELAQLSSDIAWTLERLRTGKERQKLLMDQLLDGFIEFDLLGYVRVANLSMARMLGVERNDLLNSHYNRLVPPEAAASIGEFLQWVTQEPATTSREVLEVTRPSGESLFVEVSASAILSIKGEVKGVRSLVRDVTHRQQEHLELSHRAYHDPLTGLYNRAALTNEIDELLRQRHYRKLTMGVLYLDIDHFKRVNDTLGHQCGDLLLKQIASRLRDCLRESDIVARIGGDEFVVLLQHGDSQHFEVVADKLIRSIREPFMVQGHRIDYLGVSVGISLCPQHSELPDELIHLADRAMYMAKQRGSSYAFYRHSLG
ncbi:sensor domain-containing diguanylate cyclase [Aestuariirhabdus litorea]|uniref:Diguanylate cyclase n=1 Tax=Aestuariirhabdus litorea TaxID=2528527 RepID=A0A3P3VQU3_9GAMM|nr:diguanylate cyclase [Aestuariirhabdus litorea]RRJ83193.1 diguanylate cyclase [Aestuariirhabdus litorea]RWW93350.1 diguanylate cyclase [Endozoicomonadaceae bacterium GTF-13]